MKPTHGLVPYTGIMPIEIYVDHTGPITANVKDNALLLEVIAGADGYDPRQYAPVVHPYTQALGKGVDGLRIARGAGGLRSSEVRARRRREGEEGRRAPGQAGREDHGGVDPVASPRRRALAADRRRGPDPDHDVGRRLRPEPPRSLRHEPHGLPPRVAPARQRAVGDHEALHDARHLHPQESRQPLLRQGDEHHAQADRGLRRGPRPARPPAHAHHAHEGAADAQARARHARRPSSGRSR